MNKMILHKCAVYSFKQLWKLERIKENLLTLNIYIFISSDQNEKLLDIFK